MNLRFLSFLIPILLCINISKLSVGQNCKTLNSWMKITESEFPDLNFKSLRSGSNTYNKIKYNLLSDRYFIPIFCEAFDQIREYGRIQIDYSLRRCTDNKKYPYLERLNFYIWNTFTNKRVYEQAVEQVVQIRKLRKEYQTNVQEIQSENIPFSDFEDYIRLQETKFQICFLLKLNICLK